MARERILFFNSAEELYRPVTLAADAPEVPTPGFPTMFAGNIGAAQDFETIITAAERLTYPDIHWVMPGLF